MPSRCNVCVNLIGINESSFSSLFPLLISCGRLKSCEMLLPPSNDLFLGSYLREGAANDSA